VRRLIKLVALREIDCYGSLEAASNLWPHCR
jgi:hypothetical protein